MTETNQTPVVEIETTDQNITKRLAGYAQSFAKKEKKEKEEKK